MVYSYLHWSTKCRSTISGHVLPLFSTSLWIFYCSTLCFIVSVICILIYLVWFPPPQHFIKAEIWLYSAHVLSLGLLTWIVLDGSSHDYVVSTASITVAGYFCWWWSCLWQALILVDKMMLRLLLSDLAARVTFFFIQLCVLLKMYWITFVALFSILFNNLVSESKHLPII